MKLKELKDVLYSIRGDIASCVVWDQLKREELERGCSAEYAIENYGDCEIRRICADNNYLVLEVA